VVELKEKEPNPDSNSNSENNKRKQIINVEPMVTITTTTIQPEETKDLEEGGGGALPFTNLHEEDPTTFHC
jgi:hypothetical protein